MADVTFHFDVDGADFSSAGEASVKVKKKLRQLGVSPDVIRKVSIAMYEGEINMVIHAEGGTADVTVTDEEVIIVLADKGPGIPDVSLAMKEGYSTARDNIRGYYSYPPATIPAGRNLYPCPYPSGIGRVSDTRGYNHKTIYEYYYRRLTKQYMNT